MKRAGLPLTFHLYFLRQAATDKTRPDQKRASFNQNICVFNANLYEKLYYNTKLKRVSCVGVIHAVLNCFMGYYSFIHILYSIFYIIIITPVLTCPSNEYLHALSLPSGGLGLGAQ